MTSRVHCEEQHTTNIQHTLQHFSMQHTAYSITRYAAQLMWVESRPAQPMMRADAACQEVWHGVWTRRAVGTVSTHGGSPMVWRLAAHSLAPHCAVLRKVQRWCRPSPPRPASASRDPSSILASQILAPCSAAVTSPLSRAASASRDPSHRVESWRLRS